jgi:hypothetical protein
MATTFHGFNADQTKTLRSDVAEAKRLCVVASNSLIMNVEADINPRPKELLREAFNLSGTGDEYFDKIDPIKNTFLGFQSRIDRTSLSHDSSRPSGDPNSMEFLAFVKPPDETSVFVRDIYFRRDQRTRAIALIHEYVHLRNPRNPDSGHPGGVVLSFDEADLGIKYDDAIKNPYCYQYYVDWLV